MDVPVTFRFVSLGTYILWYLCCDDCSQKDVSVSADLLRWHFSSFTCFWNWTLIDNLFFDIKYTFSISWFDRQTLYHWATREAHLESLKSHNKSILHSLWFHFNEIMLVGILIGKSYFIFFLKNSLPSLIGGWGLPWRFSGKESTCKARDTGSILWRRNWLPTPVFLPQKSHGQRGLAGYTP